MPAKITLQPGQPMSNTRLTYLGEAEMRGKVRWCQFQCSCGTTIERPLAWVRHGNTSSCGCFRSEYVADKNTKHSHAPRDKQSGAYRSWQAMHQRVQANPLYHHRSIDPRWCGDDGFANFYSDMGDRPNGMSIERIDNTKGYSPSNCKWATAKEQGNNTSQTVFVTHNGKTQSINQWCADLGINYSMIKQRRRRGMSLEDALFTPVNTAKQKGGLARKQKGVTP